MKKTTRVLTAALIMFFAFAATATAGQVYKLGFSGAITGPTSDAGNPLSKGIEDWFKYVNDNKLLGDDKIECTIRDDQYKTDVTKRNFEEYLDDGIVFYLNYSTGSTLGLKMDFEEEQMPTVPSSYHEGNLVDSTYIFIPVATYSENMVALAEYVVKNHKGGKPKVALFIHPSAFGRGPVEDTKKAVAAGLNMDIVEVVEHGKDLDNSAMLKRLMSKGVQYVICHTVQSPVATMIKDAMRLNVTAKSFGEPGKLTFLGAHYTGGADLIALAGDAAENYYWTCSYNLTTEDNEKSQKQLKLAKTYGRDDKAANSHNYAAGILQAQIPTQAIIMAKAAGLEVNPANLYKMLNQMNGAKVFNSFAAVGPVSYSANDHVGVDVVNIYKVDKGVFKAISSIESEYMKKLRAK
ncbi:MAG: ABC transporter substrate-binding protein [Desulfobacter sp.]|nr:MAG: ABC transporter substrate-binding protein [Desulfobacter sp.]